MFSAERLNWGPEFIGGLASRISRPDGNDHTDCLGPYCLTNPCGTVKNTQTAQEMLDSPMARDTPKRSYSYVNGLRVTDRVRLWRTVDVLQQHYEIWNISLPSERREKGIGVVNCYVYWGLIGERERL